MTVSETGVLLRLKAKLFANTVSSIRREPPLKTIVVTLFVSLWVCGSYYLFYRGLVFIGDFPGIGDYLISKLFYLFTLALFLMLIFSAALLAYPILYARRENSFLFSLPISLSAVILCKLGETVFLSSWAFIVLGSPLLLAYVGAAGMGVKLFFLAWLYFVPLAAISGASGLLIALVVGRYLPRYKLWIAPAAAVVLGLAAAFVVSRHGAPGDVEIDPSLRFVNQLMAKTRIGSWYLVPSRWAADGVFALAGGERGRAVFLWLLLFSNALFLFSLCRILGERLLPGGWNRRASRSPARKVLRARSWTVAGSPLRSIAAKDVLTFRRDASQWGQFALFFGLLAIYILNLRNLPYELENLFWRYLLFILNLAALGFTLAGLSSRFFFPLMSLELKRFWLLGLAPVSVKQILREKFLLCVGFTVGVTILLTLLSGLMLRVSYLLLAGSLVSVVFMGVAISALSVGIGAVYPNLKARSSAEVISGVGGTIVLVLNLIYIFFALFIQGAPLYMHLKGVVSDAYFPLSLVAGVLLLGAVSALTASLSLKAGERGLEGLDL